MSDKLVVKVFQRPDDTWIIEKARPGGLAMVEILPALTKDQAMREVVRRGYIGAEVYDKRVCAAISEGRVAGVKIP